MKQAQIIKQLKDEIAALKARIEMLEKHPMIIAVPLQPFVITPNAPAPPPPVNPWPGYPAPYIGDWPLTPNVTCTATTKKAWDDSV